ncbi:MAG TPA: hypothetical protein PLP21_15610 [Pyrinomonadaceae bacterium]|nr:hypothetical protein [Acidobacteriota bacterium]HQZ97748.1 hypothetical protein [Pyrinomonadaceae bacterium]
MKQLKIAIAFLILLVSGGHVFSQDGPPPPPPPLIWKAPASSEVKRYINSAHKFSVDFIGDPSVSEGIGVMSHYTVKRPGSLMYVRVIEFAKEDLQKVTVPEIIQQVKSAYGTTLKYSIVDLLSEKSDAIEFSASDTFHIRRVNARVVNGKLYELYIDVTNWHILKDHYPEKVKAFNEEANRFFKSFELQK